MSRPRGELLLWAAAALFILYGGTIPFHFTLGLDQALDRLSTLPLNPLVAPDTGRRVSMPDVAQNLLLFAPFGAFGMLALRGWRRSTSTQLAAVVGAAAALSALVETLQLFAPDRTTAVSDLAANTVGAGVGAVAAHAGWHIGRRGFDRLRARGLAGVSAFYPTVVALIVVTIAAWEPFDVTLDVSTIAGKLRALRGDPWQFAAVTDEGVEFLRYALLALSASIWLRQLGTRRSALRGAAAVGGLAVALEGSQGMFGSRTPGLADVMVHVAGAAAGAGLSVRWPWRRSPAFWCGAMCAATAMSAALWLLAPFTWAATRRPFMWIPFASYYERTTLGTLSHTVELVLLYFPLGFTFSMALRKRAASAAAGVAAFVIAFPLETVQGWVNGRYGDVTDVGVAVLGALAGSWAGGAGWRAFSGPLANTIGSMGSGREIAEEQGPAIRPGASDSVADMRAMATAAVEPPVAVTRADFKGASVFEALATDVREMVSEQYAFRELLYQMTRRDLLLRYKQTVMGFGWAIFMPLVNTAVFSVIFTRIAPLDTGMPYPLFAYTGLLTWNLSASAFRFSVNSLTSNVALVTKVYFPKEIFPLSAVLVCLVDFVVGSLVLVGMMIYYGIGVSWSISLLPLVLVVHLAFTVGVSLLLAMANLFYRDVKYLFELAIMVWMFATSVVYPIRLAGGTVARLAAINPMTPIIESYRDVLLRGRAPDPVSFGAAALASCIIMGGAWLAFHRAEFEFAERI